MIKTHAEVKKCARFYHIGLMIKQRILDLVMSLAVKKHVTKSIIIDLVIRLNPIMKLAFLHVLQEEKNHLEH